MKRSDVFKLVLFLLVALLICQPALASVGVFDDGVKVGTATDINFTGDSVATLNGRTVNVDTDMSTTLELSGSITFQSNLLAIGMANGGVSTMATGITDIPVTFALVKMVIETKTATLGDGTQSQIITLLGIDDAAAGTLTITASTRSGWTSIAMDDEGDIVTLLWIGDTRGWIIVGQVGCAIVQFNTP